MNDDRIHACLDGELPREALSAEELRELQALERELAAVVSRVRDAPPVDLRAAVLARLPEAAPAAQPAARGLTPLRRVWSWLWEPRVVNVRLRPTYGLAAMALLLALLLSPSGRTMWRSSPRGVAATSAPAVYVQFRLDAAQAHSVSLAGSFSAWRPSVELHQVADGVWSASVPLTPGVYDYLFLVDGSRWVPDPAAPSVADDFGGTNSRLFLANPRSAL
ncbi:MAG TPA: glycogen-binding domain-containing protein [Longimicrobiaceae bacterium]|nr:glycogen-binding domain-containing protein [Longimicrobiaceae bacterium]